MLLFLCTYEQELEMTRGFGKTADGVEIVDGLVVWTNNMEVGRVDINVSELIATDGWFEVSLPDGRSVMQNGERVATVFEGRKATTRLAELV